MQNRALLALIGVLVCAGFPAAAEPAPGSSSAKRLAPGHQPALSDAAKAAAVQAGASAQAKGGPNAPAAMAALAGHAAATPSGPSVMSRPLATRAGQDLPAKAAAVQAGAAAQAELRPNARPPGTGDTRVDARLDAKPSPAIITNAQAALARSQSLDAVQESTRNSSDASPSDALPGASAKAASARPAEFTGPTVRSAKPSSMSAKSPAGIAALDAPPPKLKRDAAARRR